jgi:predicted phage-related endonuclease
MSDFDPAIRRSAWWATDSRRAVSGGLVDVLLEKAQRKEPDDLSAIEAVQMGKTIQPFLGKLFEEHSGIGVRDLDIAATHKTEPWLRAHTDFETADGGILETKNYHAQAINKFGEMDEAPRLPPEDLIQCIHEATVFNKPHVWFAVLFGGQRFRYWKIEVTDQMKDDFIKQAAEWWGMAQTGNMPEPETTDQARALYSQSREGEVIATAKLQEACLALRQIKTALKELEDKEEVLTKAIMATMADKDTLITIDGTILATWKTAKGSKRFDAKSFETAMPDLYNQFKRDMPSSRRFLLKGEK